MKYLNKIIFINSANISYAEISVDGNVHFTGTQGVGKSTVLRALLFFYNADKQRLGIQRGQKSFDEFYFKQANSYILYEVMRDNGAFTILVSRYQGRATWRFIDAPYNRDWLIESDGHVLGDWVKIRDRIEANVSVSARIDSGTAYKDILFGNTKDSKYAKYALIQSPYYQNVTRSIQNVFLNTKLDADFVKTTIIQSMADEELPVDLKAYRRLVHDFEREYEEIDCWFRKSKDGSVPVRKTAVKVAEDGRKIIALDQRVLDVWRMLNYAVSDSEKQIPILESEAKELNLQLNKIKKNRNEIEYEYNKEKDSLNQKLGASKQKLSEISSKRKYFEENKIEAKLRLAERENGVKQEIADKERLLNRLLSEHSTIEDKYRTAKEELRIAEKKQELAKEEERNNKRTEYQAKRDKILDEKSAALEECFHEFNTWRKESDERLKTLLEEQHRADSSLKELAKWHPKEEEKSAILKELHALDVEEKDKCAELKEIEHEINSVQDDFKKQCETLQEKAEKEKGTIENERNNFKQRITEIDVLLEKYDGSFYRWLTENVDNWERTIGKIVNEENVLYAQGLEPYLEEQTDCVYGVHLNLDSIEPAFHSPEMLRAEKESLDKQWREAGETLMQINENLDKGMAALSKKLTEKLNPIRQKRTVLKVEVEKIPFRRQNMQNSFHSLEMEEKEIIEKERQERQRIYNEALLKVEDENTARSKCDAENEKRRKNAESACQKSLKTLDLQLKDDEEKIKDEIHTFRKEFERNIAQLDEQMKDELSGKGVDTKLLDAYQRESSDLKQILKQIDSNREIVTEYRVAERDLFSTEGQLRSEVKATEFSLRLVDQKFIDKKNRYQKKISELETSVRKTEQAISDKKNGLEEYRKALETEHLVSDSLISDNIEIKSSESCRKLLDELRGAVNDQRHAVEKLKYDVIEFNKYFKPQNAFNFNTMPVSEDDYLQIAFCLQEFLDNNKIEEFRKRTSEHYKDIIGRISTEIGTLLTRRSEVDRIIQEINRDFIEKNFAGVIKVIELRAVESSDKLMQLLISIQSYTEENALSIGETNLFSNDNRDEVNRKVVDYLKSLASLLQDQSSRETVSLGDTFTLQFRVRENDNDTGWVERISNVGSDGTDILVKAMVNIMLINVFKKKASRKSGDFIVHCMMDEIGRLHPNNIKGILQFANSRNIFLINSSPTSYNPYDYKYTYMLSKHNLKTRVDRIMKKTF